jgi:hypothetical protein
MSGPFHLAKVDIAISKFGTIIMSGQLPTGMRE